MSARRPTVRRCQFCRSTEGDLVAEQLDGLKIRKGAVQRVTAVYHQACLDEQEARDKATAARENQELLDALNAHRAEQGLEPLPSPFTTA